jgi:hypothetical protein
MDQLFGEASTALCSMMEARMRIHASPEQKTARAETAPVAPAMPTAFGPSSTQPALPSVFSYAASFKHAA